MPRRRASIQQILLLAALALMGACGSGAGIPDNQAAGAATTPSLEPPPPGPERPGPGDEPTETPDPWATLASNPNTGTSDIGYTCWLRFELFRITTISRLTLPEDLDFAQAQTSVNIKDLLAVPLRDRATKLRDDPRLRQLAALAETSAPYANFAGALVGAVDQLSSGTTAEVDFAAMPEMEAYWSASQVAPECAKV